MEIFYENLRMYKTPAHWNITITNRALRLCIISMRRFIIYKYSSRKHANYLGTSPEAVLSYTFMLINYNEKHYAKISQHLQIKSQEKIFSNVTLQKTLSQVLQWYFEKIAGQQFFSPPINHCYLLMKTSLVFLYKTASRFHAIK